MSAWVVTIVAGVLAYLAVAGALYLAQDRLLFPRSLTHRGHLPLPAGVERVELEIGGGERLIGHVLRRPRARDIVLLFTGNAWNAEDCLIYSSQRLPDVHLMAFHYRGYAPSEGTPSEAALLEDARAQRDLALKLFPQSDPASPARVFAVGYSIGTGVAARLAGEGLVSGAVLVTPFDSVEAVAAGRYFFVPVSLLLRHRFRSDLALAGKDVPIAVIAASHDQVIPKARTDALVAELMRPVLVETVQGAGHASLYDLAAFDRLLAQALDAVRTASPMVARPAVHPGEASLLPQEGVTSRS